MMFVPSGVTPTIRDAFYGSQQIYKTHPRGSKVDYLMNGIPVIMLMSIPKGETSPIWWNKNGNSFYIFYEFYALQP
jgi:hypothetical protein